MLKFNFVAEPFAFSVSRADTEEVLFDTTGNKLVFESQYIYIKTNLPNQPHLYGLGQSYFSIPIRSTELIKT
jgi:alpha-glucosidase